MNDFSFDEWAELYKSNPEEFELKRKEMLDAEIMKAPPEHRSSLRAIQLECDLLRAITTPLQATIEISKMMCNKLNELKTPLTQLRQIIEDDNEAQKS